jgi:surfactin synthase thioesterase subunit
MIGQISDKKMTASLFQVDGLSLDTGKLKKLMKFIWPYFRPESRVIAFYVQMSNSSSRR